MTPSIRPIVLPALAALAIPAALWAAQPELTARGANASAKAAELKAIDPHRAGYAIGADVARSILARLEADHVAVDRAALAKGFADVLAGIQPEMTEGEIQRLLIDLEVEVATRDALQRLQSDPLFAHLAQENAQRGTAFQQSFARRAGVTKMPSGLMYEIAQPGAGDPVGDAAIITVTYTGTTATGVRYTEGQAARVEVASLLPAVRDAAKGMRAGEQRVLVIPPELAFGIAGHDAIGPNETLIVTAELLEIER